MFGMHVREEKGIQIFIGKQERKKEKPPGRCKHRWEDNSKKDLKG
jgi:hypothetical protein